MENFTLEYTGAETEHVSGKLALVSQIPTSFSRIEDAGGNIINADRTATIVESGTPYWNLVDGNANQYQMTGTRTNSTWESESEKYELWMPNPDTDGWTLKYSTKVGALWVTQWNETITTSWTATILNFLEHNTRTVWTTPSIVKSDTVALVSQLPTKTSDLTNDSGFITASEVPTPSYIEDANGNKIEADLDYIHSNSHDPWTYIDDPYTSHEVTMNYDSASNTWIGYTEAGTKYVLEYDAYAEDLWKCAVYD